MASGFDFPIHSSLTSACVPDGFRSPEVSPVSEMSQLMASALAEVKSQLQDDLRQLVQEEMASLRRPFVGGC